MKHFVTLQDYKDHELQDILQLAKEMKAHWHAPLLKGKKLGMIFFSPSFRTRFSFKLAMFEMGGYAFDLLAGKDIWDIETKAGAVMDGDSREHINELVAVFSRYCDVLGVRTNAKGLRWEEDKQDPVLQAYVHRATVPFVNLQSTLYHPCQALADWMTLRENLGELKGKKVTLSWTWHPTNAPTMAVPNSFAMAIARAGVDLTIACPEAYELDHDITESIKTNAKQSGGSFRYCNDLQEASTGAHVIYAKSWRSISNYGDTVAEQEKKKKLKDWIISEPLMKETDNALFMHSLPVRRNVVVTDGVIDSAQSCVIDQAENRLHIQKAILSKMFEYNSI